MNRLWLALAGFLVLAVAPPPLAAQEHGHKKEFTVAPDRAMSVTREVLLHQGYEVVSVETHGDEQIVYYRRGNMGHGKGKGPKMKMIIRHVENRVVFVDTPDAVLVDINVRLRL